MGRKNDPSGNRVNSEHAAPKGEARRKPIETESFVEVGGVLVNTKDLSPELRQKLADWLAVTYLNEVFKGRAVFSTRKKNAETATMRNNSHDSKDVQTV